jgi:hypothetical protein
MAAVRGLATWQVTTWKSSGLNHWLILGLESAPLPCDPAARGY